MRTRFLLSNQLRLLGWFLAIPGFVLGYFALYQHFKIPGFGLSIWPRSPFFHNPVYQDLTSTLALLLVIAGLFMVAFSKEKKEDELTARMRLNALYWAVLINYLIYLIWLIVTLTIGVLQLDKDALGSFADMLGMATYNLFTPLLIFIGRYNYLRYSKNGEYKVDQLFFLPEKPYKLIGQVISAPLVILILLGLTGSWFVKGSFELAEWVEVAFLFLPVSLLIWGYSKPRDEDEFVSSLRLESMQLAVYINYAVLLLANCFLFFTDFMLVMFLNLGTIALFFVIRFNYILRKHYRDNTKGSLAL